MERSDEAGREHCAAVKGKERNPMKLIGALVAAFIAATVGGTLFGADQDAPKVGDKAPDFKLTGSDGKEYTLHQFKGKSAVVVAWYPKALTGG